MLNTQHSGPDMILLTGTTTTPMNSSWRCPSRSAMIFTVIICCAGMLIFTCGWPRFPSEALRLGDINAIACACVSHLVALVPHGVKVRGDDVRFVHLVRIGRLDHAVSARRGALRRRGKRCTARDQNRVARQR